MLRASLPRSSFRSSSSSSTVLAPRSIRHQSTVVRLKSSTRKYTKEHEWIEVGSNGIGTVGISEFAQNALGDVVYVDLPQVGATFAKKQTIVAVESVKAASDVYAPVSGTVTEVNTKLSTDPSAVNKSPYGDGWMVKLKLSNPKEVEDLLNEDQYQKHCENEKH